MSFDRQTWVDRNLAYKLNAAQLNRIEKGIADLHNRPLVSALPVTPVDGDEIYYLADATPNYGGPFLWHLRYRAAATSASKWEVVAKPMDLRKYDVNGTTVAVNTRTDLGVSIAVPLAGDYEIAYSCVIQANKAADSNPVVAISKNALGTVLDEDIAPISPAGSATFGWTGEQSAVTRKTLAANDVVILGGRSFTANSTIFSSKQLRICPIRVGP